jgi:hypothetical protein
VRLHRERLEADKDLTERKFGADQQLARERFNYDRQQAIFKRRFELAEQVLADTYRLRDLMAFVRNSASFDEEGSTRPATEHESESVKRLRNQYFVPIERLQKENKFLGMMLARRDACRTHFGPNAEKAFDNFHRAIHSVKVSASALIQYAGEDDRPGQEFMEKLRHDIWQPMAEYKGQDHIGKLIDEGVALIEGFCRPVLEWIDRP